MLILMEDMLKLSIPKIGMMTPQEEISLLMRFILILMEIFLILLMEKKIYPMDQYDLLVTPQKELKKIT